MDNQNIFYVNVPPRFEEIIIKYNAIVRSVRANRDYDEWTFRREKGAVLFLKEHVEGANRVTYDIDPAHLIM